MLYICLVNIIPNTFFNLNALQFQILIVELNRGWNSRLGFSLQPDPISGKTMISAIYADSVAARDGRLREGDRLLMVNMMHNFTI